MTKRFVYDVVHCVYFMFRDFVSIANQRKGGRSAAQVKYVKDENEVQYAFKIACSGSKMFTKNVLHCRPWSSNGVDVLTGLPHFLCKTTFTCIGGSNPDRSMELGIAHAPTYPGKGLKSSRYEVVLTHVCTCTCICTM